MGQYTIRGGVDGRERLRLLSRVMWPTTSRLLERIGVATGMACLDAGCGGGDVAFELARLVGTNGRVVGFDLDEIKLKLARAEAAQQQLTNLDFHVGDVNAFEGQDQFDVAYVRFLLTHLREPAAAVRHLHRTVRPGGVIVVEDVDFSGLFCYPDSAAVRRFIELNTTIMRARGGDPNIGPRLPLLLREAGFSDVQIDVVQPAAMEGEVKVLVPVTLENVFDTVVADGLASPEEVERLIADLYDYARNPATVLSLPRIVQAWGRRLLG